MVRRNSIDAYHCEPCLPRKYFTRSVSRSCVDQSSLATQPGDHVPLVEEVPRAQVPTPEPEVQDSIFGFHEDSSQLVSRLFDTITQFWSLIIRVEALPLSQAQGEERQDGPLSPPSTISNDIAGRKDCSDGAEDSLSCDAVDEPLSDDTMSDEDELEMEDYMPSSENHANPTTFNLESLLLGEELKRLRVWKATFSDDELNRLPFIEHELAQGVLKCLTSVANTLVNRYSERQALLESEDLAKPLRNLIEQVEVTISVADDVMTDCARISEAQGADSTVGYETPLKTLGFDIDRLQMLSQSLRLGLSNGIISTANG